jgi:hypothetical protein
MTKYSLRFNKENLLAFELEFFKKDGKYKNLRYGQAICDEFHMLGCSCELFYIQDTSYARSLVW